MKANKSKVKKVYNKGEREGVAWRTRSMKAKQEKHGEYCAEDVWWPFRGWHLSCHQGGAKVEGDMMNPLSMLLLSCRKRRLARVRNKGSQEKE